MAKASPKIVETPPEVVSELRRLAQQYLVHCFLYYRLNEAIAGDNVYDKIAKALRKLRLAHPQAPMPYADVIDPILGPEVSGFQIRNYPPQIISDAFKLLYAYNRPQVEFTEFVERRGYKAELAG